MKYVDKILKCDYSALRCCDEVLYGIPGGFHSVDKCLIFNSPLRQYPSESCWAFFCWGARFLSLYRMVYIYIHISYYPLPLGDFQGFQWWVVNAPEANVNFWDDTRGGHCQRFVTSLVVLLRRTESEKTWKSNHLQMSLQRQHFLRGYLKTLSVGPAGVWTHHLPHASPVLFQLS